MDIILAVLADGEKKGVVGNLELILKTSKIINGLQSTGTYVIMRSQMLVNSKPRANH